MACHAAAVPLVATSACPAVGVAGTDVPFTFATVGDGRVPDRSPPTADVPVNCTQLTAVVPMVNVTPGAFFSMKPWPPLTVPVATNTTAPGNWEPASMSFARVRTYLVETDPRS